MNSCNCNNTSLGNVELDCMNRKDSIKFNCTEIYLNNFKKQETEKCQAYCPLECDSVSYSFSTPYTYKTPGSVSFNMYFVSV